ncbi:MAG: DinB family protein [Planctomycetales bacterium]
MLAELEIPLQQIKDAREYTLSLLEDLEPDDWFRMPQEPVSHIAWQAGHLAMAQFRLCLERLRNLQPGDWDLISKDFIRCFGRGTTPGAGAENYPTPLEIRSTMDRVFEAVVKEVPQYTGDDLNNPLPNPHPIFKTKLEALYFCSKHEMLHAGQIGLLRRLLGKVPLR